MLACLANCGLLRLFTLSTQLHLLCVSYSLLSTCRRYQTQQVSRKHALNPLFTIKSFMQTNLSPQYM